MSAYGQMTIIRGEYVILLACTHHQSIATPGIEASFQMVVHEANEMLSSVTNHEEDPDKSRHFTLFRTHATLELIVDEVPFFFTVN